MSYDNEAIMQTLHRWGAYSERYRLPAWNEIPDIGLYMEQVTELLTGFLNVPETAIEGEAFIAASTINNYVRKRVMPKPIKKKYYRRHIAYLIVIYTLKYCLSIANIQRMLPADLSEAETERMYTDYVARHKAAVDRFTAHVRAAETALSQSDEDDAPGRLITTTAVLGGLSRMLASQLLQENGRAPGSADA